MRIAYFVALLTALLIAQCFAVDGTQANLANQRSLVNALIKQLDDENGLNRLAAAKALINIGLSVSNEVGSAVSILRANNADRALNAFVSAGSDAVPLMMALVMESNGDMHDNSGIAGLAGMGSNAIPGLEITLRSQDPELRTATISVLRLLSLNSQTRLPAARLLIHTATTEKDDWLRVYAIDALGYFGVFNEAPESVCKTLHELLSDPLEKARVTAACSLAKSCP